jgi:hypothetical protein
MDKIIVFSKKKFYGRIVEYDKNGNEELDTWEIRDEQGFVVFFGVFSELKKEFYIPDY